MVLARIHAKMITCVQQTRAVSQIVYVMTTLMIAPANMDITNPLQKIDAFVTRGATGKGVVIHQRRMNTTKYTG
jgi:predicted solute-binding protein